MKTTLTLVDFVKRHERCRIGKTCNTIILSDEICNFIKINVVVSAHSPDV